MKYLKYLLGIILLIGVLFFGRGLLTPEVSYENLVEVNKPAKEAWAVMSDETKMSEWISGFIKTEQVSGTPNTIGAVANVYIEEGGEEMVMQETITNLKPNEVMAMNFTMDFMDMDYEIEFSESDGNTAIKSKSITRGNSLFARSMISFITGAMKKQEDENLSNLKRLIEANTNNYFPGTQTESSTH
jgi:hypothetical protein